MKSILKIAGIACLIALNCPVAEAQKKREAIGGAEAKVEFPVAQPVDANVNKPYDGAVLNVSPPGFCWWRAGEYGKVKYRLFVYDTKGNEFFVSKETLEPVSIPDKPFPAGQYTWVVKAYDVANGKELASREKASFTITENAYPLPMPDCAALIAKIPAAHPKLIFNREDLPKLRQDLQTVNKVQYDLIRAKADSGLQKELLPDPVFHLRNEKDKIEYAQKRTDYRVEYHAFGDMYLDAVEPMAFVYMVTGEKKYGEGAKRHLLRLCDLPLDGALVLYDSKFDEITLQIADAIPRAYDWAYDAFTDAERQRMEKWMVTLADSLTLRMSAKKRDFYFYSGESHDGRVPPYLMNFAMCLSNHPEAAAKWLDFALTASLSVYPQWGTEDGGWAEGVDYALTYSGRFIPPIEALYRNTGFDLWQRPFYKNFPYFLTYCISPCGEISPFGDSEDGGVGGTKSAIIQSMLRFYAERNKDPEMRWWVDLFKYNAEDVDRSMKGLIQDIMLHDAVKPRKPDHIKQERIFPGVGWAAIHADITSPDNELFLLFKSSPFGPESHSHLDQNSFAIMKGGKALAIPAGSRYPQHGSPFHTKYTRQTLAHNTILVNGAGQVEKDPNSNGRIFASDATEHISYVAGEAHRSYGPGVVRYDRHMVMLRPSAILIVDDIELREPGRIDWLLHGKESFLLDEAAQSLISTRSGERMQVRFVAPLPMKFSQSEEWPMDPKEGYPMVKTRNPANQYHFTGAIEGKVSKIRIATVMTVGEDTKTTVVPYKMNDGATVTLLFANKSKADVKLNTGAQANVMEIAYTPAKGKKETLNVAVK